MAFRGASVLLGLLLLSRPVLPENTLGSCRCDCCETQLQGEAEGLQCALILSDEQQSRFMSPFRASGHQTCGEICQRDPNDPVLTAAETEQLDYERFCFYECRPTGSQPGAACQRMKESETNGLVKDSSGNARSPGFVAVVPPPAPALEPPSQIPQALQSVQQGAYAAATGGDWGTIEKSGEIGARAEQVAKDANKESDQAKKNDDAVTTVMKTNQGVMPAVLSNSEQARDGAREAHKEEVYLTELAAEMRAGASQAANDQIKDTLKALKKSSRAAGKAEGEIKAKKLWEKMKAMAPKAAAKAGKPYIAALTRAVGYAGEYQKRADALVGMSISMQMDAQMTLGGAQAFMSLGDTAKAQKMFQTAHVTMNMATGLNGQANGFYNAARGIMGTLGAYVGESLQAGYHDAVLWNPDYPPPAPALVFVQESAKTTKRHGGASDEGAPSVADAGAVAPPPAQMAAPESPAPERTHAAAAAAAAAALASSGAGAPRAEAIR